MYVWSNCGCGPGSCMFSLGEMVCVAAPTVGMIVLLTQQSAGTTTAQVSVGPKTSGGTETAEDCALEQQPSGRFDRGLTCCTPTFWRLVRLVVGQKAVNVPATGGKRMLVCIRGRGGGVAPCEPCAHNVRAEKRADACGVP